MNAEEARVELIKVLELNDDMSSWDEVVYYAAKARSSLRMSNATVKRRTEQLSAVLKLPADTSWVDAIIEVDRLAAPATADNAFGQYQVRTAETAIYPDNGKGTDAAVTYCVFGLVGEAGEVAGKWKKYLRDGVPRDLVLSQIEDEMGDVLWYLARLADEFGRSLSEIAERNQIKLAGRKERGTIGGSGDSR